jgi:2-keto-4-pentenoate hydratase/2-oxohepta-3-ene-1,7-dioic acid hydratase in catechol pathway
MKILCVGKNYGAHVKEMGGAPSEAPVWFWKPESAIVRDGEPVVLPPGVGAVHHEVELAVRIGKAARRLDPARARRHVDAFTVAVDVTARDLQTAAKKAGNPWAQSKGYDTFLPLGEWWAAEADTDLQGIDLRLSVNGQQRQKGSTRDMLMDVPRLLALATTWTTLRKGDLLLTGTPEGVGPIVPGQTMVAEAVGYARISNPVLSE